MAYFVTLLAVIVGDQLTKAWILDVFQLYEAREVVPGFFNLVYVTNPGAAFSLLADMDSPWRHIFFVAIGVIALIGLTVAYFKLKKVSTWYFLPLALIAGGAAGNLIDRLRFGSVIDFLDFYVGSYHWPAFNVADSAICVGAVVFVILNIFDAKKQG